MNRNTLAIGSGAVLVLLILGTVALKSVAYVVDERELAVVVQFGEPVKERREPGLYFKMPLVQQVIKLPRTRQFWGGSVVSDLPTKDDKKIEIMPWAVWRINDPTLFVQRLRTMENAQVRVQQFTRGAMRDVITQFDLAEIVRTSDRALYTSSGQVGTEPGAPNVDVEPTAEVRRVRMNIQHGRQVILKQIKEDCQSLLAGEVDSATGEGGRGIELIDLGISHIEFVESVRVKTFDRWVAEREAISARNINEGKRMQQAIINQAGAEVQQIVGQGQQRANEIRGTVDAEVIRKYAEAIEKTGEFYTFVRTLEAYETAISKDTRLILTTDSDFLGMIKQLPKLSTSSSPASSE